ncbi:MAG: YhcH/YjgK/YiaL family protein [Elusimicrobiales bacterium]|nr:YhcH/YjgK/YiaL family protein [Elusimicrobiales bacterium]
MIAVKLENAARQAPRGEGLRKALEFLTRPGAAALPDGRYELDGEKVYALVQRYETLAQDRPRFEAHRKYIDVQFLAAGEEVIGWAPLSAVGITEPYDGEKDVCFGFAAGAWTPVRLAAGELAILYPEDAHAPRLAAGAPAQVAKIVVKVANDI